MPFPWARSCSGWIPAIARVRCARSFRAWEGGGEYNVARGLRRCFGMDTGVVTALAQNDVGYLIEDLILQGGVDTSMIRWVPFDGIGRKVRNGLNFTERGFGVRGALGVSDRANTPPRSSNPAMWIGTTSLAAWSALVPYRPASSPRCRDDGGGGHRSGQGGEALRHDRLL